jgi:predicted nucleic acid-binding Zn ribbon protein
MKNPKKNDADFEPIGNILGNVLNKFRLDLGFESDNISRIWDNIVGDAVCKNTKPAGFKGQILLVYVSSSVWIQELQYYKKDIISRLNNELGKELVCDIKFKIGAV